MPWGILAWGALGVALHIGLARFAYGVVLPSLRIDLGLDYTTGGLLNAIHLGGYLAGTLTGPALARRFGMHRTARWAHLLVVAGALLCAAVPSGGTLGPLLLGAGRLASGYGAGPAVIAIMVSVLSRVPEAQRVSASVLMWTGMAVAILGCGLGVAWLIEPGAWRYAFAAAAACALVLAIGLPAPAQVPADAASGQAFALAAVMSRRWAFIVATYASFGLGYIAYATFAGSRMSAAGASVATMTLSWATLGVATVVGSAFTLVLLARVALRTHALSFAMASAAVGSAIAIGSSDTAAFVGAIGVGLGLAATPALITAAARTRSTAADYARAFSVATAALGIGQLVGPVIAGALADRFGPAAAPAFAAAAYAVGAVCAELDRRLSG
ncbi:MAG: YbfB/YjiJ family MFS transporter [Lautropia sp.]